MTEFHLKDTKDAKKEDKEEDFPLSRVPALILAGLRIVLSLVLSSLCPLCLCGEPCPPKKLDPAAWGGDHVGKPFPEFTSGDECLFCHRMDIGPTWKDNRHGQTIRAKDGQFLLGHGDRQRQLRKGEQFGKLDLFDPVTKEWDQKAFGDSCAGCHCTGVDAKTRSFTALSLDCVVCHGEPPDKHTKDGSQALLSRKGREPARVVLSICAQCHVRTATAKSTGRPYPNTFVPGDNLFRDFQVDLTDEAIKQLNPGDAHVLENIRDVVLLGQEDVTCLSCHDVHKQSSTKHHRIAESDLCLQCHNPTGAKKERKPNQVHSKLCGY
jgi:predicted CXXCH cytochrome family protein